MSIKTSIKEQACTFYLEELPSTVRSSIVFKDKEVANEEGAPAIMPLLGLPDILSIEISPHEDHDYDCIKITLDKNSSWNQSPSKRSKTKLELITSHLEKKLYKDGIPLLSNDRTQYTDPKFIDKIQDYLDQLAQKRTIKTSKHHGGIKATSYDYATKVICLEFSGVCSTNCGEKYGTTKRRGTEGVILNNLCEKFPGAFSRPIARFTDATP